MPAINVHVRILGLRSGRNLTQDELASRLGITRAALSHYEKGRRVPDYETLIKIADLFRVSVDYLIGRSDNPHPSMDKEIREFAESLELSDEQLLRRYALMIDGSSLTPEEAKRFIAFVRAERGMKV